MDTNLLIINGGTVKTSEEGIVEGLGIVFTSESDPDQSSMRDFFTPDTFVRKSSSFSIPVYYNHGLGPIKTEVGEAILTKSEDGWRTVAKLYDDDVSQSVLEAVKTEQHGFSTGALQHLVRREAKSNNTNFLKQWVVGEISLTPTPAEPKAVVESIKSVDGEIIREEFWKDEPKEDEKKSMETLVALYDENGVEIWNNGSEEAAPKEGAKSIEIKYASGSVTYDLYIYNEDTETGTEIVAYQWSGADKWFNDVQSLLNAARDSMKSNPEEDLDKRVETLVEKLLTKNAQSKPDDETKDVSETGQELADLRTKFSESEDALTKANEKIARLEILAGAKETVDKYTDDNQNKTKGKK